MTNPFFFFVVNDDDSAYFVGIGKIISYWGYLYDYEYLFLNFNVLLWMVRRGHGSA